MGGFECTDQLNVHGDRVDLLALTGHLEQASADYALITQMGIKTVREGIRWSQVEQQPYVYDFSAVARMIDAARLHGVQQIWDICHFGYPDDLSPLHPHFTVRFTAVCRAFAIFFKSYCPDEQLIVTPVNEVGFISWLGGEEGATAPYTRGLGWDVKYALIKAYIQGIRMIKMIDAAALIMTTEPVVNIVPPLSASPEQLITAAHDHELQYQAVDMLTGRICPELGGSPELIDYIGLNFYYNNQWISGEFAFLPWANLEPDTRWRGLSSLMLEVFLRYNKPLVLAETSHPGEHRPNWIEMIGRECAEAMAAGVPLAGICLYPIIDRPDWDDLSNWHHSGLWDADAEHPRDRRLDRAYADAILLVQHRLRTCNSIGSMPLATSHSDHALL